MYSFLAPAAHRLVSNVNFIASMNLYAVKCTACYYLQLRNRTSYSAKSEKRKFFYNLSSLESRES